MLLVGDQNGAVGELDLIAGPTGHDLGGGHHAGRQAIGVEQLIADLDLAHGGPASRRRQRGVQGQGLAHTGPRRHDDHLTRMQAVGQIVEFGETGGHTTGHTAVRGDGVDLVHRGLQQVFERDEVLGGTAVGNLVHLGLRAVDDGGHVGALGARVAVLDHPGAGLHQPAQQGLLGHDAGVVTGVGGGGHRGDQRVQIGGAADALEQTAPVQLGRHRHGVGGLTAPVEVQDGVVDVLVGGAVEIARAQLLQHVGDGVLAQQHAAEDRLLGSHVLRRLTPVVLARRWSRGTRLSEIVNHCHG